jgi:hypothetical protein
LDVGVVQDIGDEPFGHGGRIGGGGGRGNDE